MNVDLALMIAAGVLAFVFLIRKVKSLKQMQSIENFKRIHSKDDLETAFAADLTVLFKHSTRCPISARAYDEMQAFTRSNPDVPAYLIDVINQRAFSSQISERLGITHQSPQVIVIKDGTPMWNGSHNDITAESLRSQVGRLIA